MVVQRHHPLLPDADWILEVLDQIKQVQSDMTGMKCMKEKA